MSGAIFEELQSAFQAFTRASAAYEASPGTSDESVAELREAHERFVALLPSEQAETLRENFTKDLAESLSAKRRFLTFCRRVAHGLELPTMSDAEMVEAVRVQIREHGGEL